MVQMVTKEPEFHDMPTRCYTLPFIATESLCVDNARLNKLIFEDEENRVMLALLSFVDVPEEIQLNSTLCGYFNKILSFWLIKHPNQMVSFFAQHQKSYLNIVDHIYFNSSIVDAVIRICCVQGLDEAAENQLNEIRSDIIRTLVNNLEHNHDDVFMTEQIFSILSGLLKKCYIMVQPNALFQEMLSPFIMKPILDFTFDSNFGPNTVMGANFLTILLYNLYISEPENALQDVMEPNFGFQVTSIAGMDVTN